MELAAKYDPSGIEEKWYSYWMQKGFFKSTPDDREPYTIVIPPPNVTGVLHMGHMLNNTIQDILVRRARMKGKNACWLPGTDHASIATEAKVVAKLKADGIDKKNLTREQFLNHAWEWKEKHGGIILEQLKKLGASCDWDRTKFTMDPEMSESVIKVFVDLYEKGYIYRGVRMVNWDPKALTALSDEEVIFKEVNSKLYYLNYQVDGEPGKFLQIATTRPETILGDTAVCVHPEDDRFKDFVGKKVLVPLINRAIPVIADDYVDREFGTGALKITPAHDLNDYNIGIRHRLPSIDIFNDNGTLNEKAEILIGEDRFAARDKIIEMLKAGNFLVKTEELVNNVGFSERTDAVIEPKLSLQWFLDMTKISGPALENVMNDSVKFFPPKFKNTYRHWMENVRDWCISRQLWWGQRIPAYYLPNGEILVAETREKAEEILAEKYKDQFTSGDLVQDDDVLDTWFSSWLWPISVFDGIRNPENPDIKYYYPTNDLITAPEILFFWVARMIMSGYEYRGEKPFRNVYLTGIVRDKLGRKMSKSLGNSPDPIALMNTYGADGVRIGMLFSSPAGNDLLFDESLCEQGRNFCNKIWNAFRLVKGWKVNPALRVPQHRKVAVEWFDSKMNHTIAQLDDMFEKFRLSEALMVTYKLVWDDFCSWYLEIIKPAYQQPMDRHTYGVTVYFFEQILKLLHPFMPFITEELWHSFRTRHEHESLILAPYPEAKPFRQHKIDEFIYAQDVINTIRNVRTERSIPNRDSIILAIKKNNLERPMLTYDSVVAKLCNISELKYIFGKMDNSVSFVVGSTEFFVPIAGGLNKEEELVKLREELKYTKGFLESVMKKLNNERFVKSAPAQVVESERKKQADSESRIAVLEMQIANLQ
ncbi:MAG: valine--tRNA ligase [Bacteroidetes bacterium]|nr:valine--tRNA ligase [Bacteroidota bacterium]MBU1720639.1 valine--tRNA ligase [Bacteroidota bacterium]